MSKPYITISTNCYFPNATDHGTIIQTGIACKKNSLYKSIELAKALK